MSKIVLVRTPRELVKLNQIGYGWKDINFSAYTTDDELLKVGFKGKSIGRKTNQIKTFFNLKARDCVVVPVSGAIAIAEVIGNKSYVNPSPFKFAENRIEVKYLSDKNGNVFIPRKSLSTALQTRLKIQMAIARLDGFSGDIEKLKAGLDSGELHTIRTEVVFEIERQKGIFTEELLKRLQSGKVGIQAGGYGLEKLIKELLQIEGYEATIQAKNQTSGIADIDIKATKQNNVTGKEEKLLIQVKHHNGTTSTTGVKQLIASTETGDKILITTADSLDSVASKLAEDNSIIVRNGVELVDWIYENIELLSNETREQLGIAIVPVLIPLQFPPETAITV